MMARARVDLLPVCGCIASRSKGPDIDLQHCGRLIAVQIILGQVRWYS